MKKRLISLILALMLACVPALAMEKAAPAADWAALEKYASFEENGTVWTVRSNQGAAALNRMGSETAPYAGYACFGLELTGDSETGLIVPVLAFYYAGGTKLNAQNVSIAAGGVRYDAALAAETIQLGKNSVEKMTAPLDEAGLQMIHEILNAEEVNIALQGEVTFNMEPDQKATYASAREELSARSLSALSDMLYEFERLGGYDLWDLNEIWWERTRGVEPMLQATALPAEDIATTEEPAVEFKAPMYMLSRGAQGEAVRDLQELLIDAGYLQGKADGGYGEGTVRAVRAAQLYLGLMPTGAADETLVSRLLGGAPADGPAVVSEEAVRLYTLGEACEVTVERHWIADAVESAGGDRRTVTDKDDTLIIYEGTVRNLSQDDLDFYWQLTASVKCGGYEYPCVLVCERNEGASLRTALPPIGEARLLIYAEVPETAADGEWALTLGADGAEIVIE